MVEMRGWFRIVVGITCLCLQLVPVLGAEPDQMKASTGCGSSPPVKPGRSAPTTLDFDGLEREYRLHLPVGYEEDTPVPLVLVIHGYTGTAEGTENDDTSFSRHADQHGYAVVYPQATGFETGEVRITSWNDRACNASPGPEGSTCTEDADDYPTPPECEPRECDWCSCYDDVGFIDTLLDAIESTVCVDLDRVFATGISNGGMFVHRLGCDLSARFAAIAPVAGTPARGFNCAPGANSKISLLNIYGTRDDVVRFDGAPSSDGFLYTPTEQVIAAWAGSESQGCAGEVSPYETSMDGVEGWNCLQRAGCSTGAEIVDCAWNGEHDWPRHSGDEFASEVIWEFFARNGR